MQTSSASPARIPNAKTTLDVLLDDDLFGGEVHVGALSRTSSRTGDAIHFEYDPRWLDRNATPQHFALDLELPLARGKHVAQADASELTAAMRTAAYYRIKTDNAKRIVDGIRTVVATWERVAKATGARASEIHDMRAVVDPDR